MLGGSLASGNVGAERSIISMDRFVIRGIGPSSPSVEARLLSRRKWQADAYQLDGKLSAAYKNSLLNALLLSYDEIGSFSQSNRSHDFSPAEKPIVTCVEFDSQGIYVASVSSSGNLSIHDFENLYCTSRGCEAERATPIVHFNTLHMLEAVRWNPTNQEEVACVASGSSKVCFYDIASFSQVPRQILRFKPRTERGHAVSLFDLSYCASDKERMIACGNDNSVHVWDRRIGKFPTMSLPASTGGGDLNTLQLSRDEHLVLAGSEGGLITLWDLRGGRNSAAFVTAGEGYHPPLRSIQVAKLLLGVPGSKAQANIKNSSVHSISLNPSCGHHLGFHLNNGCSGVLDLLNFSVSHIHRPPYPWANHDCAPSSIGRRRRPAWLTSYPVYATGCKMACEISFLDFTPGPVSHCSVEKNRHVEHTAREESWLQTSEPVVAVASHPKNDYLLAGTQAGSLLLIGQMKKSAMTEEEDLKLSSRETTGDRNCNEDVS